MSYDSEANGSVPNRAPLINRANSGRSKEEIREQLNIWTENIIKLEKFNDSFDDRKPRPKSARSQVNELIQRTAGILQRWKQLLSAYDGEDTPSYTRKMGTLASRFQDVITEIRDKEDKELHAVRQSVARNSILDNNLDNNEESEISKKQKLQLEPELQILEEAEYYDDVIEERQKDINKIGKIMGDVREIAKDFALEVNMQGDKIVDIEK